MTQSAGNQFLHTAPWQKVLISIVGLFALIGILALVYTWFEGGGSSNFLLRFLTPEPEEVIYTEEEKLEILRSLQAGNQDQPMTPEEEAKDVQHKQEVLNSLQVSNESEQPSESEKLNTIEALRSAQ